MADSLAHFHPLVGRWFAETYAKPTDVQQKSWPPIAAGRHALITAPTGSGKTLTAFLNALDAFATGRYATGATRVLYVSPLKALNNDIERNLIAPLAGLRATFDAAGEEYPRVRVATRSGDTPADERQRLLRHPPEILITTPESFQLLLTTVPGRSALATIEAVVLDEVHAVADNRRGVVLVSCLERLAAIAGEFQRVALSATVRPLDRIAAFVAGLDAYGAQREIDIVESAAEKRIAYTVSYPESVRIAVDNGQKIWEPLAHVFRDTIARNRSTLFFTNSRRLAEKLASTINATDDGTLAYAHHGSLSREIRTEVEARLKSGQLRAIVATNSLEMGIDIGALDEVVLIQAPPSISSALQRIGRAGHRVGEISRGTLYPTHPSDFVEGATLGRAIAERDIEALTPLEAPLDVLAQIVVSMTATEPWDVDALYALLTRSFSYRRLSRAAFDGVIEMLAGRYAGTRVRDLKPRIAFDRVNRVIEANKGAVHALYGSGGTIPDRGNYHLRHAETGALLGELDEEFVWEAIVGNVFSFGTQSWQIKRITHNDVLVTPAAASGIAPPFWRAEGSSRSFHYSARIGAFLEAAAERLATKEGRRVLEHELAAMSGFDGESTRYLIDYLDRQREHTGADLPHRHHVLIERIATGPGGYRGPLLEHQLVMHTGWGGRVNRALALALHAVLEQADAVAPEIYSDDDAIVVQAKDDFDLETVLDRIARDDLDRLLRRSLEASGFFGARFRECAGRSLLLTRQRFRERLPLWMSRLHAKKLMSAIKQFADFPILLEAWRTCLVDELDLTALRTLLDELLRGEIRVTRVETETPSPFAANVAWGQIAASYMYADDSPESGAPSALSDDLIRALTHDDALRPKLERAVIETFVQKRQRLAPGYAPQDALDLGEWLKERVLIGADEWRALLAAAPESVGASIAIATWQRGAQAFVAHRELERVLATALFEAPAQDAPDVGDERDREDLVRDILSFFGPLTREEIARRVPLEADALDDVLRSLVDAKALVGGRLVRDSEEVHFCDVDNLETLLRLQRSAARPTFAPRTIESLPGFFASWHRVDAAPTATAIAETLDRLRAYVAPVSAWLDDFIEARHPGALDHDFDAALATTGSIWLGRGAERITCISPDDAQLLDLPDAHPIDGAFRDPSARYPFRQLADRIDADLSGTAGSSASEQLWSAVWAGAVTADSVQPLRRGLTLDFKLPPPEPSSVPPRSAAHSTRQRKRARVLSQGWPGNWHLTPRLDRTERDALDDFEDAKDRARMLLDRYGFVCRELIARESDEFRAATLYRALRVMELAGEVTAGLFFMQLSGPQFALPAAVRTLERAQSVADWWVSALDPIAPCGLTSACNGLALPQRRAGNYLAFRASRLVLVAETFGRRLRFAADFGDEDWSSAAALLTHILRIRRVIPLDTIDDAPPAQHARFAHLSDTFDARRDHRGVELTLGRS